MLKFKSILLFCNSWKTHLTFLMRNSHLMSKSRFIVLDTYKEDGCLLSRFSNIKGRKPILAAQIFSTNSANESGDLMDNGKEAELQTIACSENSEAERRNELVMAMKFLRSQGCTKEDIKKKCAKYINTHGSYYKVLLISELYPDILMLMPLMTVSLVSLKAAAKQARDDKSEIVEFPNRIEYLSHHLEVSPEDLIADLAKHSSLLTMQFYRLKHKMNILKDAQISSKYIAKDLWIFNYNEKLLVTRIVAAREAEVELKPWMLRCSERIFQSMLTKNSETQRILNGQDEISYLAKRLDCSKEYVEYIMEKNKLLKTINIPKLEQVLNFLYEKGYTPQEVRLFSRVFCSSVQTLNKKFIEFQKLKSTLPTIPQLCITTKKLQSKINKKVL